MDDIETAFAAMAGSDRIVLAVSGGPDSVALMLMARAWSGRAAVHVATVDHALRKESRAEAEKVGKWANDLGFPHAILTWEGAKPNTKIQEVARLARYRLLLAHAREIGATGIVTAHHADDQAETVLFRLTRGSGVAGLAGMRKISALDGLKLWRPLLDVAKTSLVLLCELAEHPFMSDPSNHNPAFARVHLRGLADMLAQEGLTSARLATLARRAAAVEDVLAGVVEKARADWPARRKSGLFSGDAHYLASQPEEIARRLLTAEILEVSGSREMLRLERLEHAWDELSRAICAKQKGALNLGGTIMRVTPEGRLSIGREGTRKRGAAGPRTSSALVPPQD